MLKIRSILIALAMLWCSAASAFLQVSIGINVPVYPQLVPVPGYPVYYAPRLPANFFFYDGLYWVYYDDYWYSSSWYNGPWWLVEPEFVPVFILRVPVRYYRQPPVYFHAWRSDAPPRWGEHWGHDWEQNRRGWDRWNRNAAPAPAPLPVYQRQFSGDRYPRQVEQQQELHQQKYRYQPRDPVVRERYQEQAVQQGAPAERGARQQDTRRSIPDQGPPASRAQSQPRAGEEVQGSMPPPPPRERREARDHRQPPPLPGPEQREQRSMPHQKEGPPPPRERSEMQNRQQPPELGQRERAYGRDETPQGKDAARKPRGGPERERGQDRKE